MKSFIYSGYTKFAAAVFGILLLSVGMLNVANGFVQYCEDKPYYIYRFENSFSNSAFIQSKLGGAEYALSNAYIASADEENDASFDENLGERLSRMYGSDVVNYYVAVNDKVYTNCDAKSAEDLKNVRMYRYAARDRDENITYEGTICNNPMNAFADLSAISQFNTDDEITVCVNISDADAATFEKAWNRQAKFIRNAFVNVLTCAVLALLLLIYLICVTGKNRYGDAKAMRIDSVWTEVHLAIVIAAVIGVIGLCVIVLDAYEASYLPVYMVYSLIGASTAIGGAAAVISSLSIVRKIKYGTFLKTSVICRVVLWCRKVLIRLLKWLWRQLKRCQNAGKKILSRKSSVLIMTALFVYTAAIGFCGLLPPEGGIIIGMVFFGIAAFILTYRGTDIDRIRTGASAIRNGNLQYKISNIRSEDMKALAENINEIGEGLEKTVAAQLKAERLKTDLITNVSHDLKTPLTSIISYTELLSKIDDLPEEAKDYVSVIAKKSARLKNLTQDLFEVSKVQSGNETFNMEKLDAALLVSQTLGEHNSEIQRSELNFCVNTDKELYFTADGRKMSRVLGNLIDNTVKYAMKGTRVFVSAKARENQIVIEIKNISAYPMDFEAEDITGRFVRGDEARTTEGNGLGLAIAKSYTEACGGQFDVILDGDLFKIILSFERV